MPPSPPNLPLPPLPPQILLLKVFLFLDFKETPERPHAELCWLASLQIVVKLLQVVVSCCIQHMIHE